MLKCPHCHSTDVYVSRSQDSLVYRLVLLAKVRCHNCCSCFFTKAWNAISRAA